ncbi:MAG TPA: thioesterase family protein [Ktedonobacterales bacterium]
MTTRFDADTAVMKVGEDASGEMTFEGRVGTVWRVARGANGGYVAALMLRAMEMALGDPSRPPRSLTIHYLAPTEEDTFRVRIQVERSGRTLATLSARLIQRGKTIAIALAAFGAARESMVFGEARMPEIPPPESLPALHPPTPGVPSFSRQYDYRWALGDPPFSGSDSSRVGGWLRLGEPRVADALLVAAMMDAWMPCVFPRLEQPISAPTIDLTIHFRTQLPLATARPDDFYCAVFSSRLAADGYFEEDGELWSRDGQLLAHSRQLAMLPIVR